MGIPEKTVLIVEDERALADIFAMWLSAQYDIRVAYSGSEALEQFDEAVDCVLLDRRMPGVTGDEVLAEIRSQGSDVPVAMVTAVEPEFNVIEQGFDDYIIKPIAEEELFKLVEHLFGLRDYDDQLQKYFQLASTKAALETSKTNIELRESDAYHRLVEEFERVEEQVDGLRADIEDPFSRF